MNPRRGIVLLALCIYAISLSGCSSKPETHTSAPAVGGGATGGTGPSAPAGQPGAPIHSSNPQDALNNPNVPSGTKDQIRDYMQSRGQQPPR
jgi:hypothetical protein